MEQQDRPVPDLELPEEGDEVEVRTRIGIRRARKARWTGATWIFQVLTDDGTDCWITSTPEGWVECTEEGTIEESSIGLARPNRPLP